LIILLEIRCKLLAFQGMQTAQNMYNPPLFNLIIQAASSCGKITVPFAAKFF